MESTAVSSRGLMRGTGLKMTVLPAGESARPDDFLNTSVNNVSPGYFATMGIAWLAGRNFTGREDRDAVPKPVIVNQAFVRRFGAGRSVLGARFGTAAVNAGPAKPVFEVIGVVADTKYRSLREPIHPILYGLKFEGSFILHIRTRSKPESVIAPMYRLLAKLDPRLSYIEVTTLEEEVQASLWAERVAAFLTTVFSLAAALIAGGGLYALVFFAVTQRRREIGIRIALGALPRDVAALMFVRVAYLAGAGIAVGLTCAWFVVPRIAPMLYEVRPRNSTVLFTAAACAFVVTGIGGLIPSLNAGRLHPGSVLRQE